MTVDLSWNRNVERVRRIITRKQNDARVMNLACQISGASHNSSGNGPVLLFNASTRLGGMSQNAAFQLLTGWGLQLEGIPVVHFVCKSGLSRCVLGTNRDKPYQKPPCKTCFHQSVVNTKDARVVYLQPEENVDLHQKIKNLPLADLMIFSFNGIPLGELVLPSLRWVLRRNTLTDDAETTWLFREYILSAYQVIDQVSRTLEDLKPSAVVLFNGQFYPEASAAWAARQRGIRVISHEVGLMPFTGYFTTGEATAYPIDIPRDFELSDEQNARLDAYLS